MTAKRSAKERKARRAERPLETTGELEELRLEFEEFQKKINDRLDKIEVWIAHKDLNSSYARETVV